MIWHDFTSKSVDITKNGQAFCIKNGWIDKLDGPSSTSFLLATPTSKKYKKLHQHALGSLHHLNPWFSFVRNSSFSLGLLNISWVVSHPSQPPASVWRTWRLIAGTIPILSILSLVTAASMVFQVTWSRPCLLAFVMSVTETFQTDPQLKQHILNRQLQEVYLLHTLNQSRAKPRSPKDFLDNKQQSSREWYLTQ